MSVIVVNAAASGYGSPNARRIDRCQNGNIVTAVQLDSTVTFYVSADDGQTWSIACTLTVASPEQFSFFIDVDDFLHVAFYATTTNGEYVRGTPNSARTAWTFSGAQLFAAGSVSPAFFDLIAYKYGTGYKVHVVYEVYDSVDVQKSVLLSNIDISSSGNITVDPNSIHIDSLNNNASKWPSIDFHHTGNGKTLKNDTPHLFITYPAGPVGSPARGLRLNIGKFSGGSRSWSGYGVNTDYDTQYDSLGHKNWLLALWDGTAIMIAGRAVDEQGSGANKLILYEFTVDGAKTLKNDSTVNANDYGQGSATFDNNRNMYFFWRSSADGKVYYDKWDRVAGSFTRVLLYTPAVLVSGYVASRRSGTHNTIDAGYFDDNTNELIYHKAVAFNNPPYAPTVVYPISNETIDAAVAHRFEWDFADPDSGDSQSKYDIRYRISGSATWTAINNNISANTFHDFTADTFSVEDYEWQVKTYDAAGLGGPWSDSGFFSTATTPPTPTITDPANNQTIAEDTHTVTWSVPSQDKYQVRKVADNAGVPDETTIYFDTGMVISTTARQRTLEFPTNNRTEHIQVRVEYNTLTSLWASVKVNVSFTPPGAPTFTVSAAAFLGAISLAIDNPAPLVGEPTVTRNSIKRRVQGTTDFVTLNSNVAPDTTYVDYEAESGTTYEYQVVAHGDNSTSTASDIKTGVVTYYDWWLKDPDDTDDRMTLFVDTDPLSIQQKEDQAVFNPLGRGYPLIVRDMVRGDVFDIDLQFVTAEEREQFLRLRDKQKRLLLQSPIRQWYISLGSDGVRNVLNTNDPYEKYSIQCIEVER